VSFKF